MLHCLQYLNSRKESPRITSVASLNGWLLLTSTVAIKVLYSSSNSFFFMKISYFYSVPSSFSLCKVLVIRFLMQPGSVTYVESKLHRIMKTITTFAIELARTFECSPASFNFFRVVQQNYHSRTPIIPTATNTNTPLKNIFAIDTI